MRIAFVSIMTHSPWAACEVLWAQTAQLALEKGHDVLISVYDWSDRPAPVADLQRRGAQLHLRPLDRWSRRSTLLTKLRQTFTALEQFQPDVICLSQGGTYDIARGGSTSALRGTLARIGAPYILLCHCEQRAPTGRKLRTARQAFARAILVGMLADKLRILSEAHLDTTIPNARVFHNPVNLQRIEQLLWPTDRTLRFAFVGRLEPVKNLHSLIEALANAPWQDRDWTLTAYGEGASKDMLEAQINQRGITHRVRFAGHVKDIAAVWASHHALILPSRFEGVPLAMIEAMLCGRPTVATDTGGISEWLEDGRSGFLIKNPTIENIGNALERLWQARTQLEAMGKYAHQQTVAKRDADPAGTLLQWIRQAQLNSCSTFESRSAERQDLSNNRLPNTRNMISRERPAISVVIPTYEPQEFLIDAVKSVLAQDPGAEIMQIAIVDDGSTRVRAASLLAGITSADRIEYYGHPENLGLAGNWNRAISIARGDFIHILHQDDTVREGFYAKLLKGLSSSSRIGMAFCRHAFIDESDRIDRISHRERWRAGVLPRWLERIGEAQRIQCPAAIVRREVYEALGGFRSDLGYALDWEMWVRIASRYEVWYEPQVLAHYRRHDSTETARLKAAGRTTADMITAIEAFSAHLPSTRRARLKQRAYRRLVRSHSRRAAKLLKAGLPQLALKQIKSARTALNRLPENLAKHWMRSKLVRVEARLASRNSQISR